MDLYFNDSGDIEVSTSGDVAVTPTVWRDYAQQAYMRIMTQPGDFLLYPTFGAEMSNLYGLPNTPSTAELGKQIIMAALARDNKFLGRAIDIKAVPVGVATIRFDIHVTVGNRDELVLQVEQDLGVA